MISFKKSIDVKEVNLTLDLRLSSSLVIIYNIKKFY